MISRGIIEWLETCPQITLLDMSQTVMDAQGLYKQPSQTVQELIDGSKFITNNYYVLFEKSAQIDAERLSSEEILEAFEDWIEEQEMTQNYPDIGYPVEAVGISNGYYMMNREHDKATYQATLQLQYYKER